MAENFNFTEGTGAVGAADDISGVKYQKVKLVDGTEDATTIIAAGVGVAANALRVALATSSEIIANLSATDNAVLDAIQTAIEACQTALEATLTIEGTVDLGATDNAVLDAIQAAAEAIKTAVEGTLTVDGTAAVTGTVTANLDATNTGYLLAIKTAIEILDNAIAGTEMQVDVVGALPAGSNLLGKVSIDQVTANANEVVVKSGTLTGITNDVSIDDGGNSITVDGTVTAELSATDNGVLDDIKTAVEGTLVVDATGQGDVPITLDGEAVVLGAGSAAIGKLAANSGVDIGDVDVLSIAAGENHIGEIGLADDTITITCTVDTSAYASGDVLFDTQEIAGAVRVNGDTCILQSVHVIDIDDQGKEMDLIFFNAATSLGTENSAPDIDDSDVLTTLGKVNISADDYIDLGANRIATVQGIGLVLEAGAATTSLYVAGITRGTPTHSATGLTIKFGLLRN